MKNIDPHEAQTFLQVCGTTMSTQLYQKRMQQSWWLDMATAEDSSRWEEPTHQPVLMNMSEPLSILYNA